MRAACCVLPACLLLLLGCLLLACCFAFTIDHRAASGRAIKHHQATNHLKHQKPVIVIVIKPTSNKPVIVIKPVIKPCITSHASQAIKPPWSA